jgi:predicted nucleotidyltransferase
VGRARIGIPQDAIADFCRRHHIRKLALFGSVLRDDFHPASDVDVLVEFDPDHVPGLAFFDMEGELSKILGRKVDLNTPGFLSPYFRNQALAEAEVEHIAP